MTDKRREDRGEGQGEGGEGTRGGRARDKGKMSSYLLSAPFTRVLPPDAS